MRICSTFLVIAFLSFVGFTGEPVREPGATIRLQVNIYELESAQNTPVGFDWYLGNTLPGSTQFQGSAAPGGAYSSSPPSVSNSDRPATLSGILRDPQFKLVIRALEAREKGLKLLAAHEGITLSGCALKVQRPDGWNFEFTPVQDARTGRIILSVDLGQSKGDYAGYHLNSKLTLAADEAAVFGDTFIFEPKEGKKDQTSAKRLLVFIRPAAATPTAKD